MNGSLLISNYLIPTLNGRILDPTYALTLINMSRNRVQEKRNWMCMIYADSSQSIAAGNNSNSPVSLAQGFMGFVDPNLNGGYGGIRLWNGVQHVNLTEVPLNMRFSHHNGFGTFCVDYSLGLVYILGLSPNPYTVIQYIIKDPGDITLNTSWTPFPSRYHPILGLRAAARWRLGTSIDDMNAENAIDNDNEVKEMMADMIKWDTRLQIGASENQDYGAARRCGHPGPNNGYGYPYP